MSKALQVLVYQFAITMYLKLYFFVNNVLIELKRFAALAIGGSTVKGLRFPDSCTAPVLIQEERGESRELALRALCGRLFTAETIFI